jgi:mRNA interferase MazF
MRRGEVWWYQSIEEKSRPVLILTRAEAIDRLHNVIAVPATSTVRGIPTEVMLDTDDGLQVPCALNLDNTFLARKTLLVTRITNLGPHKMDEVCRALARATSC